MAATDLLAWAQQVRADFDRISASLLDLDADPTVRLLQGGMSGRSAAPAKAGSEALDRLWTLLPGLRSQLDAVDEERAKGRKADEDRIRRLLTTPVVQIDPALRAATGPASLTVSDAMNELVAAYATASDVVGRIGAAWRDGVPMVDAGRVQLDAMLADVGAFPEEAAARRALDAASDAAATDPLLLAETLGPLRQALDTAEQARRTLVARRDGLRGELDAAGAQLARIDQTVREGAVALDATREKILDPAGLLQPLDAVTVLDATPRGLTPWLARLRSTAGTDWRAAINGLAAWRQVADGTEAAAGEILRANRGPLDRRNELRGLLSSLAVKAAAAGRAEDPQLAGLHQTARDLLHVAPCDLPAASAAVDAFTQAVNRRAAPSGPDKEQR